MVRFRHAALIALLLALSLMAGSCAEAPTPVPVPRASLTPTPEATPSATPLPVDAVMTKEEAARQVLLLLDPGREPRVESVRLLSAGSLAGVIGTDRLQPFQDPELTPPGIAQLPRHEPLIVVRASSQGIDTSAGRLLGPDRLSTLPERLQEACQPPQPSSGRESIVAIYSARTGERLDAAPVHARMAILLSELESRPEIVVTVRTPSPTPTPPWPFISRPLHPTVRSTPSPPVDVPALPERQRQAMDALGLVGNRWWRYDGTLRWNGYLWDREVLTATVSELWEDESGALRSRVHYCYSGSSQDGLGGDGDGCKGGYVPDEVEIDPEGRVRQGSVEGPPYTFFALPREPVLPTDSEVGSSVRAMEDVTVPAGTFRACHVIETTVEPTTWEWSWLCPGVGSVRKERFTCDTARHFVQVIELTASGTADRPAMFVAGLPYYGLPKVTVTVPEKPPP